MQSTEKLCELFLKIILILYVNKTSTQMSNVTKYCSIVKMVWQEQYSFVVRRYSKLCYCDASEYRVEKTDVCLSHLWWTREHVSKWDAQSTKVHHWSKAAAQDKGPFTLQQLQGLRSHFGRSWQILHIQLVKESQCPPFDLCLPSSSSSPYWQNGGKLCCTTVYEPKVNSNKWNIQLWKKVVSCTSVATWVGNTVLNEVKVWSYWKCVFNRLCCII